MKNNDNGLGYENVRKKIMTENQNQLNIDQLIIDGALEKNQITLNNFNLKNPNLKTPIMVAIENSKPNIIKSLLEKAQEFGKLDELLTYKDPQSMNALDYALFCNNEYFVTLLNETNYPNPSKLELLKNKDSDGNFPLVIAAKKGLAETATIFTNWLLKGAVKIGYDYKINEYEPNDYGLDKLDYSLFVDKLGLFIDLLKIKDALDLFPIKHILIHTIKKDNADMLKQLLAAKPELIHVKLNYDSDTVFWENLPERDKAPITDSDQDDYQTLLYSAVDNIAFESLAFLLDLLLRVAPEFMTICYDGLTPIGIAIENENLDIFKIIVKKLHESDHLYNYLGDLFGGVVGNFQMCQILLKLDPKIAEQTVIDEYGFISNILECTTDWEVGTASKLISGYPNLLKVPNEDEEVTNILHKNLVLRNFKLSKLLIQKAPSLTKCINEKGQSALDIILCGMEDSRSYDKELIELLINNNCLTNYWQLLKALTIECFPIADLLVKKDPTLLKNLFKEICAEIYSKQEKLDNLAALYSYVSYVIEKLEEQQDQAQKLEELKILAVEHVISIVSAKENELEKIQYNAEQIQYLLYNTSNKNLKEEFYKIILNKAIINGNLLIVEVLSNHDNALLVQILNKPSYENSFLLDALIYAPYHNDHKKIFEKLLSLIKNVNNAVELGEDSFMTLLLYSISKNNIDAFKLLLQHQDINVDLSQVLALIDTSNDSKEFFLEAFNNYMEHQQPGILGHPNHLDELD